MSDVDFSKPIGDSGPPSGGRGRATRPRAHPLRRAAPYDMPRHAIAQGVAYTVDELGELLSVLSVWFSNANAMLGTIREQITAHHLNVPPIRCWPHHFDLDTLVSVNAARTMGVGFEPGDEYYDEPYFYVSMYPPSDPQHCPRCLRSVFGTRKISSQRSRPLIELLNLAIQRPMSRRFLWPHPGPP